jgi:ribosomal protein S4
VPTIKTARQMITHKKVLVEGKAVNIPSYIVPVELEDKITLKVSNKKIGGEKEVSDKQNLKKNE